MPSFVATAGVTFQFTAASDSTARTIPTADAVFLACAMWDGTSDTVTSTIAGAAPVASYQAVKAGGFLNYLAVFVGAPAGSQTVVLSGGDAGDAWSCGFRGIDDIDPTTPFDGQVTDTATPDSISIVTTGDGLACGVIMGSDADLFTLDTEVFEGPISSDAKNVGVASAPGTGGSVAIDWSASGGFSNFIISLGVNLRHFGDPGSPRNSRARLPANLRFA